MVSTSNKKTENNEFISITNNERRTIAVLYGYRNLYKKDYYNYQVYKNGKIDNNISEYNQSEMKVLDTLNELGFPMWHIGTYLYKDVVMATKPILEQLIHNGNVEEYERLKVGVEELKSPFYLDISRNQNEMPVSSFHELIINAIDSINSANINIDTFYQVFGYKKEEQSYGELAIKIGLYSFGMRSIDKDLSQYDNNPKIKNISHLNR